VAGLDCEHGGSSWRGRFPSRKDINRVAGFTKLAANGKDVNGWAGGEFRSKKTRFDANCTKGKGQTAWTGLTGLTGWEKSF
jgi:hypothetical protein